MHLVRHELDTLRGRLGRQTQRIERLVGDVDTFLDIYSGSDKRSVRLRRRSGRDAATARPHFLTLSIVRATERPDGYWEIGLDNLTQFSLSPLLGTLFVLLAADCGREIGDGCVGFKAQAELLAALNHKVTRRARKTRSGTNQHTARDLAQAIFELRRRLKRLVQGEVVEMRRGYGHRIAVLKEGAPDWH
jgi:hypothetical protein